MQARHLRSCWSRSPCDDHLVPRSLPAPARRSRKPTRSPVHSAPPVSNGRLSRRGRHLPAWARTHPGWGWSGAPAVLGVDRLARHGRRAALELVQSGARASSLRGRVGRTVEVGGARDADGQMRHGLIGARAMPMPLTGGDQHEVPSPDLTLLALGERPAPWRSRTRGGAGVVAQRRRRTGAGWRSSSSPPLIARHGPCGTCTVWEPHGATALTHCVLSRPRRAHAEPS